MPEQNERISVGPGIVAIQTFAVVAALANWPIGVITAVATLALTFKLPWLGVLLGVLLSACWGYFGWLIRGWDAAAALALLGFMFNVGGFGALFKPP